MNLAKLLSLALCGFALTGIILSSIFIYEVINNMTITFNIFIYYTIFIILAFSIMLFILLGSDIE